MVIMGEGGTPDLATPGKAGASPKPTLPAGLASEQGQATGGQTDQCEETARTGQDASGRLGS